MCKEASPNPPIKKERLKFRIEDRWYDVTNWAHLHPGGEDILNAFNGEDATDAFYSIHSNDAIERLQKMSSTATTKEDGERSKIGKNFRALTLQLEADGWFEHNLKYDVLLIGIAFVLYITAFVIAPVFPVLAIILLGLSMQQAGWLGHTYVHNRHPVCWWGGRIFNGVINSFSPEWWANKHCAHHALPNHTDYDSDIQLAPVFYLDAPEKKDDTFFRKFQHLYALPLFCILFLSWRQQSLFWAWDRKNYLELFLMSVGYTLLFTAFTWWVAIGGIIAGGFFVALVVTASHQSEDYYRPGERGAYDFATAQFTTTRDAYNHTWVAKWFWGGMDTQLEHHLFPMMPQYNYHAVVPIVKKFAEDNGIEYRTEPAWDLLVRNMRTMKRWADAEPITM